MSGHGLISIRFPESLLRVCRERGLRSGRDLHDTFRYVISHLPNVTVVDHSSLPEPPHELTNPRTSLYVGQVCIDVLANLSQQTKVPVSSIVRRVAYGLFVTGDLRFVQHSQNEEWRLVHVKNGAEHSSSPQQKGNARAAS